MMALPPNRMNTVIAWAARHAPVYTGANRPARIAATSVAAGVASPMNATPSIARLVSRPCPSRSAAEVEPRLPVVRSTTMPATSTMVAVHIAAPGSTGLNAGSSSANGAMPTAIVPKTAPGSS